MASSFHHFLGSFHCGSSSGQSAAELIITPSSRLGGVAGVLLARRALAVGRRRAPVGAPLDVGDERLQLVPGLEHPVVSLLGGAGGLLVGAVAGGAQVGELAVEAGQRRHQVVGEQHPQGLVGHPVDGHPGHEGPARRGERPVDGAALVHALVDVLEEVEGQPLAQAAPRADRRGVLPPRGVQRPDRRVTQAVAAVPGVQRGVEEEDAVRERVRQVRGGRVEDALGGGAGRAEPAEGDAEGEAQVVGGGLGV